MGIDFSALISTCASLFLLIALGFFLRKIGIADEDFSKKLSTLVAKVGMPCLMLHSITSLGFSPEKLKNGLWILLFGTLAHVLMAVLAKLIFWRAKDADEKKIYEFGCIFSNCAFIGYPILGALFGEIGLFYGAFYVVTYNLGCWSYGVLLMAKGKPGHTVTFKSIFLNVGMLSCILGFLLYALQAPIPSFLRTTAMHVGNLCTPLSLIVTGSLVAALPLGKTFSNGKLYLFCAVKLLALPLVFALTLHFCGADRLIGDIDLTVFLAVMTSLPPAALTSLLANMYDVKPSFAAQLVSLGTLLSPFTTLLVIKITQLVCLL
ncbi:MAG: AEC family transporter [Clostridia bacterium]|nr:AEC family transporter [Clostridia bacterium]